MIRPEIQELLDRTKPSNLPAGNKPDSPRPFKTAAVGELLDPIEKFFSSYRTDEVRALVGRSEKARIEWFSEEQVPSSLLALDDVVIIVHNHLADCPCYTNYGCRRVK